MPTIPALPSTQDHLNVLARNSVVISLILPGVKPTLLGDALRRACPEAEFHWTNDGLFSSDKTLRAAAIDQVIGFWAIVNQAGGHIIHGREVMGFWNLFASSPWITVLGNPLWRAMDSYKNILGDTAHPLHEELASSGLSIGDFFASSISRPVRNRQSCKLLTVSTTQEMEPAWLIKHARRRLEHFAWVGLEGIDVGPQPQLTQALRSDILNVSPPVIGKLRNSRTVLNSNEKRVIREANAADFQLWETFRRKRFLSFFRKGRHA